MSSSSEPRPHGRLLAAVMRRWRRWVVPGVALAVVAGSATWVLRTDVGIPEDHFSSPPDPCRLLSEQTTHELVEDSRSLGRRDHSGRSSPWLHHRVALRVCDVDSSEIEGGSLLITLSWYTSTQFNLGPAGAERAGNHFEASREVFRERNQSDCSHEQRGERGSACGFRSDIGSDIVGFDLHIQRENVYIWIIFSRLDPDFSDQRLDELMAEVTGEVLSHLDDPP